MTPAADRTAETRPAYGLFPAEDFQVTTGEAAASLDSDTLPQAVWFFLEETIAVPAPGFPVAGFDPSLTAQRDLERWVTLTAPGSDRVYPGVVWIGASQVMAHARLDCGGDSLHAPGRTTPFSLMPRIASNGAYYNSDSRTFFSQRELRMRGEYVQGGFVARCIWPEDYRLDPAASVCAIDPSAPAIREFVRSESPGSAQFAFATQVVWQRHSESGLKRAGRPVIGMLLNGAQGDDDEAHAGHFSLLTGTVGARGEMHDWLVANYYTLATVSEKGIIPAMLPLENFMADLNSGQAWYRPSWMLVATLRDERTAVRLSSAQARIFNHYYHYPMAYHHAVANCAGISISTLWALGWGVPLLGATSWLKALVALPLIAMKARSLAKGKAMFDYLTEEQTRLLPALAFEQAGADLLRIVSGKATRSFSVFEELLKQDAEEILLVRIPQLPSSRAWGDYPVASVEEYQHRLPNDPAMQKIIPVEDRNFPPGFEKAVAPGRKLLRSDYAVAAIILVIVLACTGAVASWIHYSPSGVIQ